MPEQAQRLSWNELLHPRIPHGAGGGRFTEKDDPGGLGALAGAKARALRELSWPLDNALHTEAGDPDKGGPEGGAALGARAAVEDAARALERKDFPAALQSLTEAKAWVDDAVPRRRSPRPETARLVRKLDAELAWLRDQVPGRREPRRGPDLPYVSDWMTQGQQAPYQSGWMTPSPKKVPPERRRLPSGGGPVQTGGAVTDYTARSLLSLRLEIARSR